MSEISRELAEWMAEALDLGLGCISDADRAPFILLQEESGERHLVDLQTASGVIDDHLVESGREIVRTFEPGVMYAVIYDGYWTSGDEKQEAVIVEAGRRGDPAAVGLIQPYVRRKRSNTIKANGDPHVLYDLPIYGARTSKTPEFRAGRQWRRTGRDETYGKPRQVRSDAFPIGGTRRERSLGIARVTWRLVTVVRLVVLAR